MEIENLKYPVGRFQKPEQISGEMLAGFIAVISDFPGKLHKEVQHLNEQQLDTPYRPEGWTVRQVVNHCADSHMNALIRHKLALTEDNPTIKPYHEDLWAELPDTKTMPIEPALHILDGLHARWIALLKGLSETDLNRTFTHPEHNKAFTLDESIGLYAWHCDHHLAHITSLKERKGWT
ncbi:putative metal-dependent hydrolase [Pontibacter sp. KCTC 32443]|uniref:YfiT family bacillithiol transferase n=1 Tax=Pontibacter TaxID=323449 RepID=UPI00164E8D60|nr:MULTISPECIES: putative metal-dependent hydrolase [Pontibacter]MBC5774810.1 putative metal-dependent hydrolase [Pontibacter sp. KCTC 32443]